MSVKIHMMNVDICSTDRSCKTCLFLEKLTVQQNLGYDHHLDLHMSDTVSDDKLSSVLVSLIVNCEQIMVTFSRLNQ